MYRGQLKCERHKFNSYTVLDDPPFFLVTVVGSEHAQYLQNNDYAILLCLLTFTCNSFKCVSHMTQLQEIAYNTVLG